MLSGLLAFGMVTSSTATDFPAQFTHKFGQTSVPQEPKRIVSLSFIGHDFLLSLGVRPIALRKWYGDYPFGVWPWSQKALGASKPEVMFGEINLEQIAALQPDLILGLWSGMTDKQYEVLSQIAPTVAPEEQYGDFGTPWQQMTRTIGKAVGKSSEAEKAITDVKEKFAKIRADHPDWKGKSGSILWGNVLGAYTSSDLRGRFVSQLGFEISKAVDEMGGEDLSYVTISRENLDPIDTDILIWMDAGTAAQHIKALPLRHITRAYREGREIIADPLMASALSHSSPLSLNYALDRIVPLIEAAVDGDPNTVVKSSADAGILSNPTQAGASND